MNSLELETQMDRSRSVIEHLTSERTHKGTVYEKTEHALADT